MSKHFESFAAEHNKKHQLLAPIVENIIRNILDKNQIDIFSINHRVKTIDAILEKIERKNIKTQSPS